MSSVAELHYPKAAETSSHSPDRRSEILVALLSTLDKNGVRYCIPHGHEYLPEVVGLDVDLIVDEAALPDKLLCILRDHSAAIGAEVIQWLPDGAHWIVLADTSKAGPPTLIQLHVTPHFEQGGGVFYDGLEILRTRVRRGEIWVASPEIEFGCVLCNRIAKGNLKPEHSHRLSALYAKSPLACEQQVSRFWDPDNDTLLIRAAETGEWSPALAVLPQLREELLAKTQKHKLSRSIGTWARRVKRWISPPCGLHLVFLGPDGVGKSTIVAAVQNDLSPAFLSCEYHTFAPSLLPAKMQKKDSPHSKPPRGFLASMYKAGWWFICYTLGYFIAIYPGKARSALVLNHRYLLDAIADPKRYRYSGPLWILKLIAVFAPRADLVILLDGPPEVIHARKKEVALEETIRQVREYRALIEPLPNGHIINAAVPVEQTTAAVETLIIDFLRNRIRRQLKGLKQNGSLE